MTIAGPMRANSLEKRGPRWRRLSSAVLGRMNPVDGTDLSSPRRNFGRGAKKPGYFLLGLTNTGIESGFNEPVNFGPRTF
jgi:hypothetical protein